MQIKVKQLSWLLFYKLTIATSVIVHYKFALSIHAKDGEEEILKQVFSYGLEFNNVFFVMINTSHFKLHCRVVGKPHQSLIRWNNEFVFWFYCWRNHFSCYITKIMNAVRNILSGTF